MAACGVPKFIESTQLLLSGSDDHHDSTLRKRKRMISNRESARRSRVRKKKHLGDLVLQNSVLRTQLDELTHQFESLTNIIINGFNSLSDDHETEASVMYGVDDELVVHCDNMLHDNLHFMVDMFLN
ncbi:hypothetical protein L1987_18295 [Smallanthus sonchifolius]|uniref:Uncharacterized protein n=1 Tax=Smallanthus sonchifolius TaxID=185202 RepID=A0ACB9J0U4_9ASTR|nr:hypothetical protein L1987_18295 [Smallanthus sonchifolius]